MDFEQWIYFIYKYSTSCKIAGKEYFQNWKVSYIYIYKFEFNLSLKIPHPNHIRVAGVSQLPPAAATQKSV